MKGMSRIFIEDQQVEELLSTEPMDVFESMDDVLEDEFESKIVETVKFVPLVAGDII